MTYQKRNETPFRFWQKEKAFTDDSSSNTVSVISLAHVLSNATLSKYTDTVSFVAVTRQLRIPKGNRNVKTAHIPIPVSSYKYNDSLL